MMKSEEGRKKESGDGVTGAERSFSHHRDSRSRKGGCRCLLFGASATGDIDCGVACA